MGGLEPDAIEEVWHGMAPPYAPLFAWVEGRGPRPFGTDPAPFRTPMLAHAIEDRDFETLAVADFSAEWKWDGIRVQAVVGRDEADRRVVRLFSRTGDDISAAFPDLAEALALSPVRSAALDGELLVVREGHVESFGTLQQRLNRKVVTAKVMADYPIHLRAYDLLFADGEDLRPLPFVDRRARLEAFVAASPLDRIDLSPVVPFADWADLAAIRLDPARAGAGEAADAIEGLMLKRRDSPYLPGRPKVVSGTNGNASPSTSTR